jgi:hypothetical protein
MAKRRVAVKGASRVRKMLARLPDDIRAEMVVDLNLLGREVLTRAQAEAPVKTGALRRALDFKVFPKTLRLRVGILRRNRDLFYGHILEVGRRARVVTRRSSTGTRHPYRVSAIPAGRFDMVGGRTKAFAKRQARERLGRIYERALRKASGRAGNE